MEITVEIQQKLFRVFVNLLFIYKNCRQTLSTLKYLKDFEHVEVR